jgi:hypothetical protein
MVACDIDPIVEDAGLEETRPGTSTKGARLKARESPTAAVLLREVILSDVRAPETRRKLWRWRIHRPSPDRKLPGPRTKLDRWPDRFAVTAADVEVLWNLPETLLRDVAMAGVQD